MLTVLLGRDELSLSSLLVPLYFVTPDRYWKSLIDKGCVIFQL